MPFNASDPIPAVYIPYRDLTGGLNTHKDPHVLDRNQLQVSQNCWYPSRGVISKRPGSINISSGASGGAGACQGLTGARYSTGSYLLLQNSNTKLFFTKFSSATGQDANWTAITTAMTTGGTLRTAQMFDPDNVFTNASGTDTVFVVNGIDVMKIWNGPGQTILVTPAAGSQPKNRTNAALITPKYISASQGNGMRLFLSGEPTEPGAVYVSDPYFPERYTFNALSTSGVVTPTYVPYLIGRNDGIEGGDVTAIEPLGPTMLVYKQSALYRMDFGFQIFGDTNFMVSPVSVSVGCIAPRSVARFDAFHCFLGVDGAYLTDGMTTRRISDNVPYFFDGDMVGNPICVDPTTAVGCRSGTRYLLFYDDGAGTGVSTGHPTRGLWFDFSILDADGYPTVGEILGMLVNGMVAMRGPTDKNTVAWCNATSDQTGEFGGPTAGGPTYSDFGASINANFSGKSDYMAEFFDPAAPLRLKNIDSTYLELSLPNDGIPRLFTVTITGDYYTTAGNSASTKAIGGASGAVVGTDLVGTGVVGTLAGGVNYQVLKIAAPAGTSGTGSGAFSTGYVFSVNVNETSTNGWNCLGYEVLVSANQVEI